MAAVLGELSLTNVSVGKVVKTIDAKANATYTLYDKFARQISTYDATKHRTSASEYDAVDRVVKSTDTFGQITSYTYQDAAKKKVTVDSFGGITTDIFDVAGNLTDVIDSLNRTTHYDYDNRNRQTKITDAEGGKTDYIYYQDGQTKSVKDSVGNVTGYIYDVAGRLVEEDSVLGSRFYGYDLVNNRTEGIDRNGRVTKYDYDNFNRVKSELWLGNGKSFTYTYDKNGNRLTASDGAIKYEYGYDHTDLLERVDRISGASPIVSFKYTYDEIGNLTQTDELVANTVTATTIYKYADPRYLNTEIIQTGVGLRSKDVRFTYDGAGLNTKIERYLDGLLKVTTTNAFDVHGRLTGITQKNGGGVIGSDSYELDLLDRLTAQTSDGVGRTIGYDNTDQVKSVTGGNSEAYSYDKNGNRTGGGYVTGSGNRLLSDGVYSYDYDAEGNRTRRTSISDSSVDEYAWDYRNRLVSVVSKNAGGGVIKTVGYEYDVDDQRVKKTVNTSATLSAGGVVENYYLDGNQIAFVTDGSGNQTFHYLYGLNVDAVMAQDSPSGMLWSLADRLGSIDTLTDANGVVVDKRTFDSFGRVLSETNPSVSFRYGYTGRERDLESGLDYYRARYYDSQVGRFISVDPMGFDAGDTNLYRYVGNSSTLATDPTGMWLNFVAGAGISLALDLGFQIKENWGTDKGIDITRLAISTISGAVGGGIASGLVKGGALVAGTALAKTGLGLGARTAINAGVGFNLGYYGQVATNRIEGHELFDGALDRGLVGGAGAAAGELLQAGVGAAWKSERVQNLAQTIRQTKAWGVAGNALNRATTIAGDLWDNLLTNVNPNKYNVTRSYNGWETSEITGVINRDGGWLRLDDGHIYARRQIEGGSGRAFAGHGMNNGGHFELPEGTSISVFQKDNRKLPEFIARAIEDGNYDALATLFSKNKKAAELLEGAQTYLPGSTMPDYMLLRPDKTMSIRYNSMSVKSTQYLSEMIESNMGNLDWAACTECAVQAVKNNLFL